MIDSHCHLAAEQFADDVDAVIARAAAAGVTTMVCIGDTIEESEKGLHIAEKNEQIFCTVGVHPHESSKWSLVTKPAPQVSTRDDILRLVRSSKKVVAIGEIGLDYHYDFSPQFEQPGNTGKFRQLHLQLSHPACIRDQQVHVSWKKTVPVIFRQYLSDGLE
jgi:TatD DNase family protein